MMYAMSSGAGIGNAVLGLRRRSAGSSTSMTTQSGPVEPRRPARRGDHAATGAASPSMNSIRASGCAGSIGRYAAPVLSTARIATIASAERGSSSATRSPGPAPWLGQQVRQPVRRPRRVRGRSHDRPPTRQRHRLRRAGHLLGEQLRNRHRQRRPAGQHRPVAPLVQPVVLAAVEQIDRRQPPFGIGWPSAGQHPLQPVDQRSTSAASNTSVSNSTRRPSS